MTGLFLILISHTHSIIMHLQQFEADREARRAYFKQVDAYELAKENVYTI